MDRRCGPIQGSLCAGAKSSSIARSLKLAARWRGSLDQRYLGAERRSEFSRIMSERQFSGSGQGGLDVAWWVDAAIAVRPINYARPVRSGLDQSLRPLVSASRAACCQSYSTEMSSTAQPLPSLDSIAYRARGVPLSTRCGKGRSSLYADRRCVDFCIKHVHPDQAAIQLSAAKPEAAAQ